MEMLSIKRPTAAILSLFAFLSACSYGASERAPAGNPARTPAPGEAGASTRLLTEQTDFEQRMQVYLTGYSYWDNTPPGSAQIARPVIHRRAGGTGTYSDPVTLAVGHVKRGSRSTADYKPGTRFYIERLRKYAIVEDLCGDGNRPQDGPCHTGHNGLPWIDLYVGGKQAGVNTATQCTYRITGVQTVIINPGPGHPVHPGPLSETGCPVF